MNDWWLKVQRAEKHMVDVQEEARRYAESKPYSFTRIRLSDPHQEIRSRFRITEQPDPMIAVMLGDFIHNLRSALDWVVVACSPKRLRYKASFPISFKDIFAKDRDGNFVVNDAKGRDRFERAIKGLPTEARAFIISLQPYQFGSFSDQISLGNISRLENADKHREIITLGSGAQNCFLDFSFPGIPKSVRFNKPLGVGLQYVKDNTVIPYRFPPDGFNLPDGSSIKPSEVDVHFTGTAKILVKVTRTEGNQPPLEMLLDSLMDTALFEVSGILNGLEQFVIR